MGIYLNQNNIMFQEVINSEIYIDKLIKKGFKVAICEQLEDPKNTKGIVKRDIIEVISSGTIINALVRSVTLALELGRSLGSAIRRAKEKKKCKYS